MAARLLGPLFVITVVVSSSLARAEEPADIARFAEEIRQLREEVQKLSKSVEELKSAGILADAKLLAEMLNEEDPERGLRLWGAQVLEKWEGSDPYREVIYRGGDAGMRYLARLPNLEVLDLSYSQITDDGMRWIAGVKGLRTLNLTGTRVGDAGLKHLAELSGLERLDLNNKDITGAGLASLRRLENLEYLRISAAAIDDESLENLAGLSKLAELGLLGLNDALSYPDRARGKFRGDGLKYLTKLKRLKDVDLTHTVLRDEAFEHLAKMPALRSLRLGVQDFGDKGLGYLKSMNALEYLEGGVDSEQQRELQDALPKLFIYNP
jgi:hypothetical protein